MNKQRIWILGASDPEMEAIEALLLSAGETAYHATAAGDRVRPGNAYRADGWNGSNVCWAAHDVACMLVECSIDLDLDYTIVDHHRPGDPGYGRPPADFMSASSIGQVLALLGREPTAEQRLVAAADHCLAAAYRGECPGIDPEELMRWRVASRAKFQGRDAADILADIERAREALRNGERMSLGIPDRYGVCTCGCKVMPTDDDPDWDYCLCPQARDMRGVRLSELPEASAREGVCFVGDGLPDKDGRVKVVCQSGTPDQIRYFMETWAPSQGLIDIYGDPARGFAGGYGTNSKE